jgi:membrane associated rhomboid family serine protease
VSFLAPEPPNPRMRAVAWGTIALFTVAGLLGLAGAIDLGAHAFPLLMGFFAIMFVAQAWARTRERGGAGE